MADVDPQMVANRIETVVTSVMHEYMRPKILDEVRRLVQEQLPAAVKYAAEGELNRMLHDAIKEHLFKRCTINIEIRENADGTGTGSNPGS